jgi:hypothetical protein
MVDIRQSFFIHQQSNNEAQWQKKELRIREYVKEEKNARRKGKNKERKKNSYYRLVLLSFGLARSPNIIIAIIREQARKNADAPTSFLPLLPTHSSMYVYAQARVPTDEVSATEEPAVTSNAIR